ncbi:hypothetical protein ACJX0J_037021, partial [Zea mays]
NMLTLSIPLILAYRFMSGLDKTIVVITLVIDEVYFIAWIHQLSTELDLLYSHVFIMLKQHITMTKFIHMYMQSVPIFTCHLCLYHPCHVCVAIEVCFIMYKFQFKSMLAIPKGYSTVLFVLILCIYPENNHIFDTSAINNMFIRATKAQRYLQIHGLQENLLMHHITWLCTQHLDSWSHNPYNGMLYIGDISTHILVLQLQISIFSLGAQQNMSYQAYVKKYNLTSHFIPKNTSKTMRWAKIGLQFFSDHDIKYALNNIFMHFLLVKIGKHKMFILLLYCSLDLLHSHVFPCLSLVNLLAYLYSHMLFNHFLSNLYVNILRDHQKPIEAKCLHQLVRACVAMPNPT